MQSKSSVKTCVAWFIGIVSIVVVFTPYFSPGIYFSTDGPFHLARIESLYIALKNGVFPAKLHFATAYTYGYGSGFFYPDFFLYFPAVLMVLGMTLELSWKVFTGAILFLLWCAMYRQTLDITSKESKLLAAVCASAYLMSNQFMGLLYGAQSVGSCVAMAFMPIFLGRFVKIMTREYSKKDLGLFTLAAVGMMESHIVTLLLAMIMMLVMAVMNLGRLRKNWKIARDVLICAVWGAGLTIAFIAPMLEQLNYQKFLFQISLICPVEENIRYPWEIPHMCGIGVMTIAVIMLGIAICQIITRKCIWDRAVVLALLGSFVYIGICFTPWFWITFASSLEFIQFPERTLDSAICLFILAGSMAIHQLKISELKSLKMLANLFNILILTAAIIGCTKTLRAYGPVDQFPDGLVTERIAGIGAGEEWMPEDGDRYGLNEPQKAYDPSGGGADGTKLNYGKSFEIYLDSTKEFYDMPYLYYYGYHAYVLNDDNSIGQELKVAKAEELAYVRVFMPKQPQTKILHVIVTYRKTLIQKLSYLLNAILGLAFVSLYFDPFAITRKTRKRTKVNE